MRDKRFSSTISPTRLELDATIYLRRENEGKRRGGGGKVSGQNESSFNAFDAFYDAFDVGAVSKRD